MRPRHIPIRTCVACRETDAKRDLLRVVRQADGTVCYDPKGKLSGRGAYVCARAECIALARKQKKLERSLKVSGLTDALFVELNARAAAMPRETAGPTQPADRGEATPSAPAAPPGVEPRVADRANEGERV
jgi:predicted RNA-binding protein YlxR (DUF448 family)